MDKQMQNDCLIKNNVHNKKVTYAPRSTPTTG